MKVYWPHLLVSLIFIFITFCAMGALAYFQLHQSEDNTPQEKITLKAIFILGWVLLGLSIIVWTVKIIKNFFIKRETYIGGVESKAAQL